MNENMTSFSTKNSEYPTLDNSNSSNTGGISFPTDFSPASLRLFFTDLISRCRQSRNLVLIVVFIALFFDNMLLTTVVPIIPDYLFTLEHPNASQEISKFLQANNLSGLETTSAAYFPDQATSNLDTYRNQQRLTEEQERWKSVQMNKLSFKVSIMFASKPVVQLVTNPLIGPLTNR